MQYVRQSSSNVAVVPVMQYIYIYSQTQHVLEVAQSLQHMHAPHCMLVHLCTLKAMAKQECQQQQDMRKNM